MRLRYKYLSFLVMAALSMIGTRSLWAEEGSKLELKAKLWTKFTLDATENSVHKLGFDIERAYFQAGYKFDETWSAVFLLDGTRGETISVKTGTGDQTTVTGSVSKANVFAYVRNLYVQAADLWPEKGTFRFGFQPTLFIPNVEAGLKTRWLGKTLTDQSGLLQSQSGGAGATGYLANSIFRYGVMAHNGLEGLTKTGATDNGLAYDAVLTFTPFINGDEFWKKLGVTVFEEFHPKSKTDKSATGVTTRGFFITSAALQFESSILDAAGEVAYQNAKGRDETLGLGLTANLKFLAEKASLYARFFTGDDAFKTLLGGKHILTVGPTYSFIKDKIQTALLYENKRALVSSGTSTNTILWNWAMNF